MLSCPPIPSLATAVWREREAAHRRRAEAHTLPARKRRDSRELNPVEDFLFEYYPYALALLEKWHPGVGTALEWSTYFGDIPQTPTCADVLK